LFGLGLFGRPLARCLYDVVRDTLERDQISTRVAHCWATYGPTRSPIIGRPIVAHGGTRVPLGHPARSLPASSIAIHPAAQCTWGPKPSGPSPGYGFSPQIAPPVAPPRLSFTNCARWALVIAPSMSPASALCIKRSSSGTSPTRPQGACPTATADPPAAGLWSEWQALAVGVTWSDHMDGGQRWLGLDHAIHALVVVTAGHATRLEAHER